MSEALQDRGGTRREFVRRLGAGALAGVLGGAGCRRTGTAAGARGPSRGAAAGAGAAPDTAARKQYTLTAKRVAADPTRLPPPVGGRGPKRVEVTLHVKEVVAQIEDGVAFRYMTYGGQVPAPMIRVRQGDTVHLTLNAAADNQFPHNVDLHAVYGTGGGSVATNVAPGKSASVEFQAMYPGAFIYHCAVPNLDFHISSGMFGMIVVEPPGGLPPVDRELYLGQHEIYLKGAAGAPGMRTFDFDAMRAEDPTYVLLNGEKDALTPSRWGSIQARRDETLRIFFVCGGPNLSSHFHPIGNVWTKAWRAGAVMSAPERYVQTMVVPPGSCGVFEMELPVPETIKLVDHALSRMVHKGMLGLIEVVGAPRPDIFNPRPGATT